MVEQPLNYSQSLITGTIASANVEVNNGNVVDENGNDMEIGVIEGDNEVEFGDPDSGVTEIKGATPSGDLIIDGTDIVVEGYGAVTLQGPNRDVSYAAGIGEGNQGSLRTDGDGRLIVEAADIVLCLDESDSIDDMSTMKNDAKTLIDEKNEGRFAFVSFEVGATLHATFSDSDQTVKDEIDLISSGTGDDSIFESEMHEGIDTSQDHIDQKGSAVDHHIVIFSDGKASIEAVVPAADDAKGKGTYITAVAGYVPQDEIDEGLMEEVSSPPKNDNDIIDDEDKYAFLEDNLAADMQSVIGQISPGFIYLS